MNKGALFSCRSSTRAKAEEESLREDSDDAKIQHRAVGTLVSFWLKLTPLLLLGWCIFAELRVLSGPQQTENSDVVGRRGPLVGVLLVMGAFLAAGKDRRDREVVECHISCG